MEQNKLDNIVVHQIENEEVAKSVLKIAEKHGAKWSDDSSPNKCTFFGRYGKRTAYHFNDNMVSYSSTDDALTMEDCLNYRFMTADKFIAEFGETKEHLEFELIPFDIDKAKAGATVVTRDGREVRILAYDLKGNNPICVVIATSDSQESTFRLTKNGVYCIDSNSEFDLFLKVPKRKNKTVTKWVNLYKTDKSVYIGLSLHNSKEEAQENNRLGKFFIDTVPVNVQVEE